MGQAFLINHRYKSSLNPPSIRGTFGIKIDTTNPNPETALTYTDDAIGFTPAKMNFTTNKFEYGSWKDVYPFNQIKPCVFKNGVVQYYLNPDDYTKRIDGSSADITSGNDGDVMVEFPKIYWKFERIGTDLYIRYSDKKVDNNFKCLAHTRGITEKDKIYLSTYMGYSDSSKLRSLSGKSPSTSETIGNFRSLAQSNGSRYEQYTYYSLLMLQVLYIIMFKNRDSQSALGRGYVDGNSSYASTGGTNNKGLFYGDSAGKKQMKFCGIEDFYGNYYYWIDGIVSVSSYNVLIGNSNFNDTGVGYTLHYTEVTSGISGYIGDISGASETGFLMKTTGGSTTSYYTDYGILYTSGVAHFGGSRSYGSGAGAFMLRLSSSASYSNADISARLAFI